LGERGKEQGRAVCGVGGERCEAHVSVALVSSIWYAPSRFCSCLSHTLLSLPHFLCLSMSLSPSLPLNLALARSFALALALALSLSRSRLRSLARARCLAFSHLLARAHSLSPSNSLALLPLFLCPLLLPPLSPVLWQIRAMRGGGGGRTAGGKCGGKSRLCRCGWFSFPPC